jgi:hypothetical protein
VHGKKGITMKSAIIALCISAMALLFAVPAYAAPTANVVFGGFNDPSGQGCANALLANGHIRGGEQVVLPGYPAHMEPWIDGGMSGSTAIGLPGGVDAVNRLRAEGKRVELHGCSQGSDVAVAVSHVTGMPSGGVHLHGSPHPAMGIFHADFIENVDVIAAMARDLGGLAVDRIPLPGTHDWYGEGDVWNNYVPNQNNPAAIVAMLNDTLGGDGHWVQPSGGQKCGFTDRFGVVNHVYDDGNPDTANGC